MLRGSAFLILVLAASVTSALGDSLNVELTVSFFPPSTFSADSQLEGAANFYIDIPAGNGPRPTDSPSPLSYLDPWDRNITVVEDTSLVDPCILDGSCGVDTSIRGTAQGFLVFAFPNNVDLPSIQPDIAPIIPIGTLAPTDPCKSRPEGPCIQGGQLVAYDFGPVRVGTWEIKLSNVPEPNGIWLAGSAILLLLLRRRPY
jgi:hypothetical protein